MTILVRVKLFALFLGPAGFGIVSQIYNFIILFTSTAHLGTPTGLTSEISKLHKKGDGSIPEYFKRFLLLFGISTSLISIVFIAFSDLIMDFLVGDKQYSYILVFALLSSPFVVMYSLSEAFLRSMENISKIVKISILSNIICLVILYPLIYYYKFLGVGIYYLVFGVTPLIMYGILNLKEIKIFLKTPKVILEKKQKLIVYKIGFISLLSSLLHQSAIILLRKFSISYFGLEDTGIYQSVLSISVTYFALLYIFLNNYTLPKLSTLNSDEDINIELNQNTKFLILLVIPMITILFTYRELAFKIFFTSSFLRATDLLFIQLSGDIFRTLAALFGLWLIPRLRIFHLILIDFIFNLSLITLPYLYYYLLGNKLLILPLTYLTAFFIHFILYFIYTTINLKFRFNQNLLKIILYSIVLILITYMILPYFKLFSYPAIIILLFIWIYLSVTKTERYKTVELIKNEYSKIKSKS